MARTLDIEPLDATFGAVVPGIKVAEVDDATSARCTTPGWNTRC